MRTILTATLAAATLASCGGGNPPGGPDSGVPETYLSVIKTRGGVQCTTAPVALATLERQLTDAGVLPRAGSCGIDGKVYPAACGNPDGKIGIFEIPSGKMQAATAAGFVLMSSEPGARKSEC